MTPDGAPGAGSAHVSEALEQLAYTADELDALAPLLRRVPEEVLEMPSIQKEGSSLFSILAVLRAVRDRELRLLTLTAPEGSSRGPVLRSDQGLAEGSAEGSATGSDVDAWRVQLSAEAQTVRQQESASPSSDVAMIVQEAAELRRQVVEHIRNGLASVAGDIDAGFVRRLFDLMHEDTSTLREIALALHAGPVTGRSE